MHGRRRRHSPPWYAGGLKFRCTACGQCCTGEPGHVWVGTDEIRAMARARGMSVRAFRKQFIRKVRGRETLTERSNGDCVMLASGRCTVYDVKPQRCTTYPFWKPVLDSPEEWDDNARKCEGIGQGDLYSLEEIETLLSGDLTPMVVKHARPPAEPVTTRYENGKRLDVPDADDATAPLEPDWDAAFEALEALYAQLDHELPRYEFTCSASGRCCDFDAFGHRLYVSTLEAEYFLRHLEKRANDDASQCPAWGSDRLCKERAGRMLGCRTYFCGPYPVEGPEALHERFMTKIKALHDRYRIPYSYRDVTAWAAERT